jgi:hypothetical protein
VSLPVFAIPFTAFIVQNCVELAVGPASIRKALITEPNRPTVSTVIVVVESREKAVNIQNALDINAS